MQGTASQIDTAFKGDASRAIDGNDDSNAAHGSCSSTANKTNSWWKVDLGKVYDISKVVITYRQLGPCKCKIILGRIMQKLSYYVIDDFSIFIIHFKSVYSKSVENKNEKMHRKDLHQRNIIRFQIIMIVCFRIYQQPGNKHIRCK